MDYVLTVSQLGDDSVTVELEQEFNSQRWRGDFSAECECGPEVAPSLPRRVQQPTVAPFPNPTASLPDIEDVTRKTGNFKRFGVFVKMLVSALESSSDAVHLDLLTYADLVSQRWSVASVAVPAV